MPGSGRPCCARLKRLLPPESPDLFYLGIRSAPGCTRNLLWRSFLTAENHLTRKPLTASRAAFTALVNAASQQLSGWKSAYDAEIGACSAAQLFSLVRVTTSAGISAFHQGLRYSMRLRKRHRAGRCRNKTGNT